MPLTMRPTGGHSPVYADRQDWTIFDDGKPVGRIYEDMSASASAELRWIWLSWLNLITRSSGIRPTSLWCQSNRSCYDEAARELLDTSRA
jgi:hypothetical protein